MSRGFRYRVLRKIAHGGMAEIFTALQVGAEGFEKPVVLKRILPALAADPAFVRMLVDEAHIASSLIHSNLVQVLDLGQAGDQFFLALEFVDGWSLEQVRKRAKKARIKLPLPLALHIVSSLCRGLDYVHRRTRNGKPLGIVHRDVTPQNVLLSREGEVKLADFGIAKASGRREKSATGVIKGKFAYMSPEQSIGAELDARSDLFSVGTLLYLLTTGQKPFEASSDLDVLMQVRRARFEKPSTLVRDFNPDVERFIVRALRADRARRWQSAEQMADRLDAILVKLGQPSGPATLKRWLESLSARDGVLPPGDLREVPEDAEGGGTMQIDSRELELQDVGKPEDPDDEDDDEPATAPLTAPVAARVATKVVALDDARGAPVAADAARTAVASDGLNAALMAKAEAAASDVPAALLAARGGAEVTKAASSDYAAALSWTGVPVPLVTPARKRARAGDEDDTIEDPVVPERVSAVAVAVAASRTETAAPKSPALPPVLARAPTKPQPALAPTKAKDEPAATKAKSEPAPTKAKSEPAPTKAKSEPAPKAQLGLAPNKAQPTKPKSEPAAIPRGISRVVRAFKRVAIGGVLFPALVIGGVYAAHPILPAWIAPPELVAFVDGWLKEIPRQIDALRERAAPRDP